MIIRTALLEDLSAIAKIEEACFPAGKLLPMKPLPSALSITRTTSEC